MINILLLNWNSSDDVKICIEKIIVSNYNEYRLILIDNNSNEIDRDKLTLFVNEIKSKFKNEVYLILNSENFGYAGGNNKGYEYIKNKNLDGDILVINPDILISENTLCQLKKVLDSDDKIGAVMCRTLNYDQEIIYDYISMNGLNQKWLKTNNETIETDYLAGSCMLLKREVIDEIGLFNNEFFMYWEEVDLSFRIKKFGYKLLSSTNTFIIRKENDKSRSYNMHYYMIRNLFLIKKLHSNVTLYDVYILLLKMFKSSLVSSYKFRDLKYILIFFKGIASGIKSSTKI